jgi:branched-chain amino acid transport system ATP-binding protein
VSAPGGLELREVTVSRQGARVVRQLSLRAQPGQVTLLLGPNGAGKTTVLEAVSGMLPVAAGHILVQDQDVRGLSRVARARRGLLHVEQGRAVFCSLTVEANLRVRGHGRDSLERAFALFPELRPRAHVPAEVLSGGEQQMLVLARALVADPSVLLVDEMSLGLAPLVVRRLLPTVRAAAGRGVTVLLVEQYANLALEYADRAYVLAGGRLSYGGPASTLRATPDLLHRAYLGERVATSGGSTPAPYHGSTKGEAPDEH